MTKPRYFKDCQTVAQIKSTWRKLCFQFHPDRGGDEEIMKEVNDQYHGALKSCNGETTFGSDGKQHSYYYKEAVEQEVMDKITELLKMDLKDCEVELVGTWIWVSGNTKQFKTELKKAGLKWHSKRLMWYFRKFNYRRKYSGGTFQDIRNAYGSRVYKDDLKNSVATA